MCILCVVQKWSRRVATLLPWLVIPLIILWALSQLLPPGLRFEITSPRLACVFVLLGTLFWYEVLMPHLSRWQSRRSARLRERSRTEALQLHKLRKTATRSCRNCHMPYRDQNPGGGRFMCSYCGHISRRPALDLPGQMASSGIIAEMVGRSGWLYDADGNEKWVGHFPRYWAGDDHRFSTERSYSQGMVLAHKLLSCFCVSLRFLCGKFFRFDLSRRDESSDLDHTGLSNKGAAGENIQESRGEKARRKAEEKRQARLEREMLEAEERKQREEVSRLVEERRRIRDEKLTAEMEQSTILSLNVDRVDRKEMDRRRRDRRKDKEKESSKNNSDNEELDKKERRNGERKQEFEKKGENERRDLHKSASDNNKSQARDGFVESKVVKNTPRSSSSASFTRNVRPVTVLKDYGRNPANRRDAHFVSNGATKLAFSADDKALEANSQEAVTTEAQKHTNAPKKSWHQLFTRSSSVYPVDANSASQVDQSGQSAALVDQLSNQNLQPGYSNSVTDSQVFFRSSLPLTTYPPTTAFNSNPVSYVLPDTAFPPLKKPPKSSASEDSDLYEDPCYEPEPISLLGPVSESLDNFPLELDSRCTSTTNGEGSLLPKAFSISADVNKPIANESPLSKLLFPEAHSSNHSVCNILSSVSSSMHEQQSTWQMWGSPLGQDGLGLIGRPASLFAPIGQNNSVQQNMHYLPHKPIISLISNNNNVLNGISTHHLTSDDHHQGGAMYGPLGAGFNDSSIWLQSPQFMHPLGVDGNDHLLPRDLIDNIPQSEVSYSSPNKSTAVQSFDSPPASSWSRDEFLLHGSQQAGSLRPGKGDADSLFSRGTDAPSAWLFNQ
ncbi:hypothetical protein HPP92_018092 [Vanilla planifolia]|uniref:Uncharacterized protein n=1 Tax=Vanilla planifolia TaxID=51239 RepID=A0A835QEY1_VANPL|nr:hypothetical protein HPP92_018092 [Vanilla planifolia]